MPPPNPKNASLTGGAVGDLGLGDQLRDSLSDAEEERRKRLLAMAGMGKQPGAFGDMALNPGASYLSGRG